ncbi:MAG: LacI family DNA-binding transcriptional regulator [Kordiimonas sp.]
MSTITINHVAERAGVSITTVSRVINNEPSVRKKTQEKVLAAIKELDYQPNLSARNLGSAKSYVMAYAYDNPNTYYVTGMQNGILEASREQGYGLLIHPCDSSSEAINDELRDLVRRSRIAGLILTPPLSEMETVTETLQELDVEFVRILSGEKLEGQAENSIIVNDRKAAYDVTEYLIGLGHKHIAFFSGEEGHGSSTERLEGYKAALSNHNIPVNDALIVPGEYSYESGDMRARDLLSSSTPVTAIFGCNDEIAAGALHAARLLNISVPDQLSIAGFEDSPYSRQAWPKITTAQQSNSTISHSAAELLIDKMRPQKSLPKKTRDAREDVTRKIGPDDRLYTPTLLVRDSTGPAPTI